MPVSPSTRWSIRSCKICSKATSKSISKSTTTRPSRLCSTTGCSAGMWVGRGHSNRHDDTDEIKAEQYPVTGRDRPRCGHQKTVSSCTQGTPKVPPGVAVYSTRSPRYVDRNHQQNRRGRDPDLLALDVVQRYHRRCRPSCP